ncbi:hypothetical protein BCR36DRAFT_356214 [Piromyces finnis]|uniref:Uncharacterized protein n=1 Tax=Piromyces finnis TaxID=1754191 RepID=A0A1Y1V486_9FUNG|nr:hypothetical protein BCR36DRAFT_356214 [Piromyces finnis]|eukprot:ORX46846.1 hypothetical protein BCR36DRAFT_356214 [Piromyces finnis]
MKFTKGLLTLFVISSSFAFNIPISKRDEIDDALAQYDKMTNSNGQINSSNSQTNVNNFNQGQINSNTNNINQGQVNSNTNNINQGQVNSNINNNVNSQNTNGNINNINISNECQNVINEYRSCFQSLRKDNYDKDNIEEYCKNFNTEKCQSLYNQGLNAVPECSNISNEFKDQIKLKFDVINYTFKLLCAKDENGNFCPISKNYIENGNTGFENSGFDKYLNETCKSKKCINSAIDAFTLLENSNLADRMPNKNNKREMVEGVDAISSIVKTLKSEGCSAQAMVQQSDATTLSITNTLLFTFGLLLLWLNN